MLVRRYRGKDIVVRVREDGFEYDGHVYRSLSSAVRTATGTPWNGFAFFRLAHQRQRMRANGLCGYSAETDQSSRKLPLQGLFPRIWAAWKMNQKEGIAKFRQIAGWLEHDYPARRIAGLLRFCGWGRPTRYPVRLTASHTH